MYLPSVTIMHVKKLTLLIKGKRSPCSLTGKIVTEFGNFVSWLCIHKRFRCIGWSPTPRNLEFNTSIFGSALGWCGLGPFTLTILIWGSSLILITLTFIGKSVAYMPYAEVKRVLEQEAQMHSTAARSASPCRLSPREVSKAAPQPDMSAACYSVPPGKYCSSVQWLLAIYLQMLDLSGLILWMNCSYNTFTCYFKITFLFLCIPSSVQSVRFTESWEICIHSRVLWHWLPRLWTFQKSCDSVYLSHHWNTWCPREPESVFFRLCKMQRGYKTSQ